MSDSSSIEPVSAIRPVAPVRPAAPVGTPAGSSSGTDRRLAAAYTTVEGLRAAYAQFVVNPETNDVVIRIKDSATGQVLRELPSPEVEAMREYLNSYFQKLNQHRTGHAAS